MIQRYQFPTRLILWVFCLTVTVTAQPKWSFHLGVGSIAQRWAPLTRIQIVLFHL
jgi:hypothetical protein